MGCSNGTCGLSGLPIFDLDPVIAFVIQRETKELGSQCYPWEAWTPASLIVRGLYDDYGGVKLDAGEMAYLKISLPHASERMERIGRGFGFVACEPFVVRDNGIRGQADGTGYGLWMAHAKVFEELRDCVLVENYMTFKSIPVAARVLSDIEAAVSATISYRSDPDGHIMENPWRRGDDGIRGAGWRCIIDELRKYSKTRECFNESILRGLAEKWGDLKALHYMMHTLHMVLYPLSGGSQDNDLISFTARNKVFAAQIKRSNQRRKS